MTGHGWPNRYPHGDAWRVPGPGAPGSVSSHPGSPGLFMPLAPAVTAGTAGNRSTGRPLRMGVVGLLSGALIGGGAGPG